jgi:hypothetical protein
MKKIVLFGLLVIGLLFGLISCGDDGNTNNHTHIWGDWEDSAEATCIEPAKQTRACQNDPSHKETRNKPESVALGHLWGDWEQISETVETRNCIRSGCTGSETQINKKNFSIGWWGEPNQIATKNFNAPPPLSSTIARRIKVSDTTIGKLWPARPVLIIIDAEGYGWASDGFVYDNIDTFYIYDLATPITVYANNGFGWYKATGDFYLPEEQASDNGFLGTNFAWTQNWIFDELNGKNINKKVSFERIYWLGEEKYINLSDAALNPEEWSIAISDSGTLTINLGVPKDEYLYSFDVFISGFCDSNGVNISTTNDNVKLLEMFDLTTTDGKKLLYAGCNAGCTIEGIEYCGGGYLVYANEDVYISGNASNRSIPVTLDINLKIGWNFIQCFESKYKATDALNGHLIWKVN